MDTAIALRDFDCYTLTIFDIDVNGFFKRHIERWWITIYFLD